MDSAPGGICTHASFSDSTLKFGNRADSDEDGDDFFGGQKVPQTPQYGRIPKTGDEGGDFIFVPIN